MAEWLEEEQSRPQPEPIITEEQLRAIFGLGTQKRQVELGVDAVTHHLHGIINAASAALNLTRQIYVFPASEVGRLMDIRNLDTELEAIKQHIIAARCLSAELRKRMR